MNLSAVKPSVSSASSFPSSFQHCNECNRGTVLFVAFVQQGGRFFSLHPETERLSLFRDAGAKFPHAEAWDDSIDNKYAPVESGTSKFCRLRAAFYSGMHKWSGAACLTGTLYLQAFSLHVIIIRSYYHFYQNIKRVKRQ